jgi:8-oxo-dGTP pyrophosphatase MutT (NUDIX family)
MAQASYGDSLGRLPREMVDHVRALASGAATPAEPRHASTVVLLRDSTDRTPHTVAPGIEAYLLRRQKSMAFAAGMYVFPGGSVDPRDEGLGADAWVGPTAAEWSGLLDADERLATALVCAAVRETFEESGVLLAGPGGSEVVADTTGDDWEADRLALLDRSLSLAEMLSRRNLLLRADLLRPWAHWITPEVEPRRFDTRFFVAALPPGQRTRDVGGEADRVTWARPDDVLNDFQAGALAMLPPTAFTLSELSAYSTVDEVLAAGDARDVKTVLPKIVLGDDDEARLLLPHDEGYPS